ncbi:MAG: hypothetical protein ACK4PR_12870 [Gammaproteobacteria bacterium]
MTKTVQDWRKEWETIENLYENKDKHKIIQGNEKLAEWQSRALAGTQTKLEKLGADSNFKTDTKMQTEYTFTSKQLLSLQKIHAINYNKKLSNLQNSPNFKTDESIKKEYDITSQELSSLITIIKSQDLEFDVNNFVQNESKRPAVIPNKELTQRFQAEITLDLLAQYAGYNGGSWPGFFNKLLLKTHSNDVKKAIINYFTLGTPESIFIEYMRVDLILAKIKMHIDNTAIERGGDLYNLLLVIKEKTGLNYFKLPVSDPLEIERQIHIPTVYGPHT